jgi:glycerophosphoryl diester phosphodiesterase
MKLFASLFLLIAYNFAMGQSTEKIQFADNIVVAHRGAWKDSNLPQNSIAALRHAIDMECTGSEFDVRMTSDEVLVVVHDKKHNSVLVEENTYAKVAEETLKNGEKLPTLKETFLEGMRDNTTTGLIVEIKPSQIPNRGDLIATKLMELIDEVGVDPYIHTFISFDYEILLKILSINPNAKTEYLNGEKTPSELAADGISGLDYHFNVYKKNPTWISEAKALGLTLNVWTVNKKKDLKFFVENGFDCISTNEPERLFKLLKKY